jgi:hypothetical protein
MVGETNKVEVGSVGSSREIFFFFLNSKIKEGQAFAHL